MPYFVAGILTRSSPRIMSSSLCSLPSDPDPPHLFRNRREQAVAVGAAVQGHILAAGDARTGGADLGGTTDLLLLDVTPLSLGIELEGREMSVLIKRNTTIPCRKSRSYTTVEDWQTSIDVVVYEVRARVCF